MILEIQATMPSPPATLRPYMNGVYIAYAVTAWCYCETPSPLQAHVHSIVDRSRHCSSVTP